MYLMEGIRFGAWKVRHVNLGLTVATVESPLELL